MPRVRWGVRTRLMHPRGITVEIAPLQRIQASIKHVIEADHQRYLGNLGEARKSLTRATNAVKDIKDLGYVSTSIGDFQAARALMKSPDNGGDPIKASSEALAGMRMLEISRYGIPR